MTTEKISSIIAENTFGNFGFCSLSKIGYLENYRKKRLLPHSLKSAIMITFPYYIGDYPNRNISRYALVDDYHTIVLQMLESICKKLKKIFPQEYFLKFVDNSPINEVNAAFHAGIGKLGLNGMLITQEYGSYVFIGSILTSMDLKYNTTSKKMCKKCGECILACPTGALSFGGFNKEICRSFITQKKHELTIAENEEIKKGGFAWGCDICLDACPHNKFPHKTPIDAFYENIESVLTLKNAEKLHETKAYNYRKPQIIIRNLNLI